MVIRRMSWAELAAHKDIFRLIDVMFRELLQCGISRERAALVRDRYAQGQGVALCAFDDDGRLAGCVSCYASLDLTLLDTVLVEHFIAVMPEHRNGTLFIRLLKAMENYAREIGVSAISTGTLNKDFSESWGRIFRQRGYREMETLYRLEVR